MDNDDLPIWTDLFLRALRQHGLVNTAATTAGVTKRTVDRLREKSAEFDYAVETALEEAADELELEARRRAVEGVEKGVWYQGEEVGTELQFSDTLLTTLLKAKRADEFAERKQITGAGGTPLTVVVRTFSEAGAAQPQMHTPNGADAGEDTRILDAEYTQLPAPTTSPDALLAEVLDMV